MATKDKLRNDLKKLQEALKKESIPSDLKTKIKSQIERVEKELKSAKPTKTATTTATTTKVLLGKLQKFVEKNKKYGSYGKTSESNLQKDAVRTALKIGKRTSEGKRSNQFGTKGSNKGHTYYEYRTNRHDVKQPKAKQTYPILEEGGMMAKGGGVDNYKHFELNAEGNFASKLNGKNYEIIYRDDKSQMYDLFENGKKIKSSKYIRDVMNFADGDMMAKGGGKLDAGVYRVGKPIKLSPILYEQKIVEIFDNGDISTASDYGRKLLDFKSQKYPIISKEQLDAQYKMAEGGMMAKGGEVSKEDIEILGVPRHKITEKEWESIIRMAKYQDGATFILKDKNYKDVFPQVEYEWYIKEKMESGGEMAKGGKLSLNTYKLRAEGLNDFLSFLQTGMYMRMKSFTIEPIGVPDVVVSFVTDASLSEIKSKLKEVPDSHVMLETIKPINEYTGERDRMMAKGGGVSEVWEQYEENEDNNLHSENVVLLAKHFGTKDDIKKAEMILKKHEEIGHIPYDLMKERDELGHKLYDKLLAAKNKKMAAGGDTDGKNGYVAFYKGKRIEVYADTSYEAQKKAADIFKAKKSWDVHVVLAEVGGKPYVHTAYAMGGVTEHGLMVDDHILRISGSDKRMTVQNGKELFHVNITTGERKKYMEDGGAIDVSGDTAGAIVQNVGGTMFSSADLTDNLTIENTGFFKQGGVVSKTHRRNN